MTKQDTIATPVAGQGIAAALIKAQASMGKALKQSNNPAFRSKYADLGNVMDACMPALNESGIAVIQPIGQDDMGMFVSTVFVHTSGERLECRVPLLVTKQDMQGFGSAVTYARRYGLMAMAGIAPEDDDGNAAAKAAPTRTAPAQAMSEGLADAWEDGVLDSLPDHASPRVKAEAFAAAICAGFQGKGHKALDNEWTRRQKWIDGLKGKYPDLYAQVETAYNSRRDQWEAENA
jgi:hypothetical protein